MKILAVCLGNICRSPLAEGLLQREVDQRGLDWEIDSAGTGDWHIGEPPDQRSVAVAKKYKLDISGQRARQFRPGDFDTYDIILTMDESNRRNVLALAQNAAHRQKVHSILPFSDQTGRAEVPDPYWNDDGFEQVYQMLATAARRTIDKLSAAH